MGNNWPCPECCTVVGTGTSGDCPCCILGTERILPLTFQGVTDGSLGECCSEMNGELFLLAFGWPTPGVQFRCRWRLYRPDICLGEEGASIGLNIELNCFPGFPTWWRTLGCFVSNRLPGPRPAFFEMDGTPEGTAPFDCLDRVELTHFSGPSDNWCNFGEEHGAIMILNPDPDDLN